MNPTRAPRILAIATASMLALSACTATSAAAPPASPQSSPADDHEHSVDAGVVVPAPEASAESEAAAIAAAELVMKTFAQPALDADSWITQLLPLLSQTGADAYVGVDPSRIPAHQVTGAGAVVDGTTEVSLIVEVPTDAGPYFVTLSRPDNQSAWLADRIRPAAAS